VFASQMHFAKIDVNLMQLGTLQSHHCTTDNSLIGNDVYDVTDNLPAAAAAALCKALAHESHVSEQFLNGTSARCRLFSVIKWEVIKSSES